MIKQKGFKNYLSDDSSLTEKITYEEFKNSQKITEQINDTVDEVYNCYHKVLENLKTNKN